MNGLQSQIVKGNLPKEINIPAEGEVCTLYLLNVMRMLTL